MKKIIFIIILLIFISTSYCSEIPFYCYGECLKSEKNSKKLAILKGKKDCIEQLCLLFMYNSDYEANKDLIYETITPDIDKYIITSKKTKFREKDQKINDEQYKTVAFYSNVDIDTFFNKLKSIKGLEGKVAKPIVFIDAKATNHYINTDESHILRSEMVQFFKDMCFDILDENIVDSQDNIIEQYKALKNANCEFYIRVVGITEMKETENLVGNLLDAVINVYKYSKDGKRHDSTDASKTMKEMSSTSTISFNIYSVDAGKINKEVRTFEGYAKGNIHIDNPAGIAHNSMKNAVEDFKKNCPLIMYEAVKTMDKNIFTLSVGNITNEDSKIITDTLKKEDKSLINICEVNADYGKNYEIITKNEFDEEVSLIEKININNEPLNIVYVNNNIVGAYVNSTDPNSVTETNYMEKLFNNFPESVVKNLSPIVELSKNENINDTNFQDFTFSIYNLDREQHESLSNALLNDKYKRIKKITYNDNTYNVKAKANLENMINILSEFSFKNGEIVFFPLFIISQNSFIGTYTYEDNILYKTDKSIKGAKLYLINIDCSKKEYSDLINYLIKEDKSLVSILYGKKATQVVSKTNIDDFKELLYNFNINNKIISLDKMEVNQEFSNLIFIQCSIIE